MTSPAEDAALTTPAALDRVARERPDHPALITEDRSLTFAQLRAEVRRAAAVIIALGVEPRDRVALWAPNSWQWVVACLGAQYAGAAVVPLNTNFTTGEAADVLARSRARLLIAMDAGAADKVAALDRAALPELRDVVRIPVGSDDPGWEGFLGAPAAAPPVLDARAAAVRPGDVADILFTSGTTGRSKGVLCAHRQSLSASGSVAAECREMTPADRYLCLAPFFHNYGYKDGLLGCLQSGSTLVTLRSFDPERAMRVIADQRITVLPGPPTLFQVLLDHPARAAHDLSSLRIASTGGATVPVSLVERILDELDVETVLTGYGLTEASGFGTACRRGDDAVTVANTCGRPIAGFELRIDSPDDSGAGEVLLRGPNVMLGYLDDPAATAAVIDADGWLHTGDVGTLDEAGNLRITDRITDIYICGGLNVYPAEVEGALGSMDGIADVAVVGVPDPRLGETGRAFVVRRPGALVEEHDVIAYSRAHLAPFKTPRSVVFLDELPRNAGGKVLKSALRQVEVTAPAPFTPAGLGGPPVGRVEHWVADTWQVLLNIGRPGRRDKFTDLGGDSLAAVEFARMLQAQFGVSISIDSLVERPSIAAVVAGLESGDDQHRQPVVRLRDDEGGPVCLMVPGIGGHAWRFTSLAAALTVPCEVRALSPMDMRPSETDTDPSGGIRARVRSAALDALRDDAAAGRPIMVAGYSFGAMIAADVACWLIEHGVPVAKFILLDPDPLTSDAPSWDSSVVEGRLNSLVFAPGSPAARQLEADIAGVSALLQEAYLDGTVRLPPTAVAWVQSEAMKEKLRSEPTLFGTPVSQVDKTVFDFEHHGMMRIPQVGRLAEWLDRELSG